MLHVRGYPHDVYAPVVRFHLGFSAIALRSRHITGERLINSTSSLLLFVHLGRIAATRQYLLATYRESASILRRL
jgi:hypothetical protein